jgi:hypothetical protein
MDEPDSPVNIAEMIEQKKRELAELAELQQLERLAAKHKMKLVVDPAYVQVAAPYPETKSSPPTKTNALTVGALVACYRVDHRSPYRQLKFAVRRNYESSLNRLVRDLGPERVAELDEAKITRCYETKWAANNKLAMGHNMVGKLRMLSTFGSTVLKDDGCTYLAGVLAHMHTKPAGARTERLTAAHVVAFRSKAHEAGRASIALAQAIQFEAPILKQLDIIGEWVPISEPGTSDVMRPKEKWLRGLRWSEIDEDLILHRTVTRGRNKQPKPVSIELRKHSMILEELFAGRGPKIDRSALPASGPIIVSETTSVPYSTDDFRRKWRVIADDAGIPDTVRNMDSIRGEDQQESQRSKATFPWQET